MNMIDNNHSFSPIIAEILTIQKALILKEIGGWCEHNQNNHKNIDEDGLAWVFMSVGSKDSDKSPKNCFSKKFPYMQDRSIHRWLQELENEEWIYSKTDNKLGYDRTKSYRLNIKKYNDAILENAIRQNGESNSHFGESNCQNGEPIHSLNNSLNKKKDIKSDSFEKKTFLNSTELLAKLNEFIMDESNVNVLSLAIMKRFDSFEAAKEFYLAVAEDFATNGFKKYKSYRRFESLNDALASFQTWCKNAKDRKNVVIKHRLWQEYTREEFEDAQMFLIKETDSPILKTRILQFDMARVLLNLGPMFEKIKNSKEFSKAEPLSMPEILKIYLRYEHKISKLKEVFSDLSYASNFKSVWNFVEKRKEFIMDK